jgi:Predicted Zn-dependent protease (DUF2268)
MGVSLELIAACLEDVGREGWGIPIDHPPRRATVKGARIGAVIGALACVAILPVAMPPVAQSAASTGFTPGAGPAIHIEDVELFYRIYDAAGGHPSADQLQHDYLDRGSEGLHHFAQVRDITAARIAKTLDQHPEIYSDAKRCLVVLPRVSQRLAVALRKLGRLYPEARFPPVTIAVGRGKPVGVGDPVSGVQIGLEALCATNYLNPDVEERFVHVIAHEFVHVQQTSSPSEDDHPTVLQSSLAEGAAEFIGELISGQVAYAQFGASTHGHEKEIETAFVRDQDNIDRSDWLYNGTPQKPGDLGYWVGYRIVKSYYQRASDKRVAVREILQLTDPKAFLSKSGWYPGERLR